MRATDRIVTRAACRIIGGTPGLCAR